jgi:hypothetical protein
MVKMMRRKFCVEDIPIHRLWNYMNVAGFSILELCWRIQSKLCEIFLFLIMHDSDYDIDDAMQMHQCSPASNILSLWRLYRVCM